MWLTRQCVNWEFAGQLRCAGFPASPPALVRGVPPVRFPGAGGSPSPAYLSQKGAKNKNSKHRKIILYDTLLPGIRTPPSLRWRRDTPLTSAGGRGRRRSRPCLSLWERCPRRGLKRALSVTAKGRDSSPIGGAKAFLGIRQIPLYLSFKSGAGDS